MLLILINCSKKWVAPWSHQAAYIRQLKKAGGAYKYNSYSYTAQRFYEKGILLSIDQFRSGESQFDGISLTISCNTPGVLIMSVRMEGVIVSGGQVEISKADLLAEQFVRFPSSL